MRLSSYFLLKNWTSGLFPVSLASIGNPQLEILEILPQVELVWDRLIWDGLPDSPTFTLRALTLL